MYDYNGIFAQNSIQNVVKRRAIFAINVTNINELTLFEDTITISHTDTLFLRNQGQ